jgi:hypothetical protein
MRSKGHGSVLPTGHEASREARRDAMRADWLSRDSITGVKPSRIDVDLEYSQ